MLYSMGHIKRNMKALPVYHVPVYCAARDHPPYNPPYLGHQVFHFLIITTNETLDTVKCILWVLRTLPVVFVGGLE